MVDVPRLDHLLDGQKNQVSSSSLQDQDIKQRIKYQALVFKIKISRQESRIKLKYL